MGRRGDLVGFVGPIAEVKQTAALTTERHFGSVERNLFLADGAEHFLLLSNGDAVGSNGLMGAQDWERIGAMNLGSVDGGFRSIRKVADQVVVVRFGDAEHAHFAGFRLAEFSVVDVADAIDFRRLGREAGFPQQVGFFGNAFDENWELTANQEAVTFQRNAALQGH